MLLIRHAREAYVYDDASRITLVAFLWLALVYHMRWGLSIGHVMYVGMLLYDRDLFPLGAVLPAGEADISFPGG